MCVYIYACIGTQSHPTLCNPMQAHQAPLSMEFPRQEYWSGLPFPTPVYIYTYVIYLKFKLTDNLVFVFTWQPYPGDHSTSIFGHVSGM